MKSLSTTQRRVFDYTVLVVLFVLDAVVVHSFMSDFAPGGVTGIAQLLEYGTGINKGVYVFLLNIPLVIMALIWLGGEFTVKSIIGVLSLSGTLVLLQKIDFFVYSPQEKYLTVLTAAALDGLCVAFIFKLAASMGGSDFVAAAIYKKNPQINIVWFVFAINVIIGIVSIFVYQERGIEPAILSIAYSFLASKICDSVMSGFKSAAKFEIITDKPDEIKQGIYEHVQRGVTIIQAKGAYSNTDRVVLLCIVRKREIPNVQHILRQFSSCFVVQTDVRSVYGHKFGSVVKSKSGL